RLAVLCRCTVKIISRAEHVAKVDMSARVLWSGFDNSPKLFDRPVNVARAQKRVGQLLTRRNDLERTRSQSDEVLELGDAAADIPPLDERRTEREAGVGPVWHGAPRMRERCNGSSGIGEAAGGIGMASGMRV